MAASWREDRQVCRPQKSKIVRAGEILNYQLLSCFTPQFALRRFFSKPGLILLKGLFGRERAKASCSSAKVVETGKFHPQI